MADLTHPGEFSNKYLALSLERPVAVMLFLYLIAVLIKILDTFVLPINELVGEAIITKAFGFLLVVAYVWFCGRKLADIGFHNRRLVPSVLIAIITIAGIFTVAHLVQLFVLRASDKNAALVLSAVDPKTGMSGGFWFGLWLVAANLVNSAMEEGLFRGLMLRHFLVRSTLWRAMLLQMVLFAVWHLNWPIYDYLSGEAVLGEALFQAAALLISTSLAALVTGYLYYRTNNLWASFVAHFINNSVLNVVFFRTAEGLQSGTELGLFLAIWLPGYLVLLPVIHLLTKRYNLPLVQPWGQFDQEAA